MRGYSGSIGSLTLTIIFASPPTPPPPAGVRPTRYSLSLISLGSPTITAVCLQSFSLGTRARGSSDRCSHLVGLELVKLCEVNSELLEVDLINLRALKLAAVVNVNALPLAEDVEDLRAGLAVAVARRLRAAEGEVNFRADGGGVDVEDAGVHLVHRVEGAVHVLRVDGGREAVAHAVADLDGLFERGDGDDGRHRPEDFLLRDAHVCRGVGEDGRLDEVAAGVLALLQPASAAGEAGAVFTLTDPDLAENLCDGGGVDDRADIGLLVEAVADF